MQRSVPHGASMPAPLPPKNRLDTFADEVKEDFDEGSTPAPCDLTDSEYDPE